MEADWQEITRIGFPPPALHAPATPVAHFVFDSSQELLWTGNGYGRVSSFYSAELQRYTSYQSNPPWMGPVKQLLVCERGIVSLSSKSVHLSIRRGLTQWHLEHNEFHDLRCMCFTSKGASEMLVAGCQATMFRIDVEKGTIVETIQATDQYTLMKRGGQYICAANASGTVQLLDLKTLTVLKSWKAHSGWINDMDANSSFLVTCGWSPRQHYGNLLDPLAKVFDLKTLMPLPPVPFHAGAAFVRMHPRMLTTGIIASQTGQLQLVDIMNSTMVTVRQANLMQDSYLLSLEIAPSGEALALTDSTCMIQLWGSPSKIHFTEYSNPTEFADATPPDRSTMDWSTHTPLNSIGMPYYRETLLSSWPGYMVFNVGAPPTKPDPSVTASLTRAEIGGYAQNPRKTRRYQVEDTRLHDKAVEVGVPKFLSEQAKDENGEGDSGRRMSDVLDAMNNTSLDGNSKVDVPVMYRSVEIKYSKFGVEDFDFEYYNRTRFSGLETHIANSYINPLLQLMKFTPWIRNLALHHTASSCLYESCLLCEMGFLFDMLEKAAGQNCQATNFLKTFSGLSDAASLGILEEGSPTHTLTMMIQSTNLFLLRKMSADYRQTSQQGSHMDQALTTVAMNNIRCAHCGNETGRPGTTYIHELLYPQLNSPKHRVRSHAPTFSQILKASIERQDQTRGWCDRCKRYQQLSARKTIQNIPPVLMINTAIHTVDSQQLWSMERWLPQEIGIIVEQGQVFCYEGQDLKFHRQRGSYNIAVYELIGVVANVQSNESQKSHLVSMINVSSSERNYRTENEWYLFNDFLVRQTSDDEALRFDPSWKLPSVLTYEIKSARHRIDDSWKNNLDTSLLYRKWALQHDDDPSQFQMLSHHDEKPKPGTPIGIDAEFVALQQEEIEVKADGSRSVIRPSRLGLARVSVVRASLTPTPEDVHTPTEQSDSGSYVSEFDLVPFIDDYIHIPDPIIDYLTMYSGISPGDLDPQTSPYASTGRLVSLKTAYKKIWLLLNLGCVFVGHGLLKDFRTINIHVPKPQVVDTVDLYFIKSRARKLSLRFLSWVVLNEEVQVDTHDSIEDARTAVKLWRKWREFEDEDRTEEVLHEIYKRGRELGFKVPVAGAMARYGTSLDAESTTSGRRTPSVAGDSAPGTPRVRKAGLASATVSPQKEGQ